MFAKRVSVSAVVFTVVLQHVMGQMWWGSRIGMNNNRLQPQTQSDEVITCVGRNFGNNGEDNIAVTIKNAPAETIANSGWFGWASSLQQNSLIAEIRVKSKNLDGVYYVVVTERSRDEQVCTTDGVGEISIRQSTPVQNSAFSRWGWNNNIGAATGSNANNGILRELVIREGHTQNIEIPSSLLPYSTLSSYAGHGVSLCSVVTPLTEINFASNAWGMPVGNPQEITNGAVCEGDIPLCCKLGYDNTDAMP